MRSELKNDDGAIPATEVWFELRKVLASKSFRNCPTLRRLLSFVTEETMEGRGALLTEYVLGVQIFGRPAAYDPRLDSRVRVAAHRLRSVLAAYYGEQGRSDRVLITLSPGSYTPSIRYRLGSERQRSTRSPGEEDIV